MGKSSSPPPAPDPYQVAGAQTQQNQNAANYNAAINRVNTYTPMGSQEYSVTGTDPRTGAPIYRQDINLTPDAQALYDQQIQQNRQLGNIAGGMMDNIPYGTQVDTSGLPQLQGSVNPGGPSLQSGYQQYDPQMNIDSSGLPKIPGQDDLGAFRNEAEKALYDRNTHYLDNDFSRREDSMRTRLANQGIVEGSEAYRNAVDDFERGRESAYGQARNSAVAGGGAEAERMYNMGANTRGQLYGEALAGGQFANNAAGMATAQNAQGAAFSNQARNQALAEALAGGQFQNQARGQGMSELFSLRNQPMNEFNALRSASQVDMPQFQGMANVGTNPADITGAFQNQYNGQIDAYNANQSGRNNLLSGLFGLGSSAILASDERVKEDIEEIGNLHDGTNVYLFRYKGDDAPQVGVMAQEIEQTQPDAVVERKGIKHVDYSKVLAKALVA